MTPTNELPAVIARYLQAADDQDIARLAQCFAADATVLDDGATHTGRDEIRAWRADAIARWTYTTEVTSSEALGGGDYLVKTHVEGDFPGGVVDLRHTFTITDGLISALRIVE